MSQKDGQSSVHPVVQAQRAEQAAQGERIANLWRDADLAHMGLPPEALALIGGGPMASWSDAQQVAAEIAGLLERAGLADAARVWYEGRARARAAGGHTWRAHERAGRVLARRVVEAMMAETEAGDGDDER